MGAAIEVFPFQMLFAFLVFPLLLMGPYSAHGDICPDGYVPQSLEVVFAVEASSETTDTALASVKSFLNVVVDELGRYISSMIRVALSSFSYDSCSLSNPCSPFLDHPVLVKQTLSQLDLPPI